MLTVLCLVEWTQSITLDLTVKTDLFQFSSSVNVRPHLMERKHRRFGKFSFDGMETDDYSIFNCENGYVFIQQFGECSTPFDGTET